MVASMAFKKITAIKWPLIQACLWLALMGASWQAAAAQLAGTVMQLSGPMMAKKADGKVKVLAIKSEVESGDTLVTEKNTYALIRFVDNSEITLKPGTTFVVEQFSYQAEQAAGDQASFSLVKGGLRSITGLLGKRSKEKFSLKTPAATIGIRGTTFIVEFVQQAPSAADARGPGLYMHVLDGMIHVANPGGSANFAAGQFGYTPAPATPPMVLPANPGLQFTPPPVFDSTSPAADSRNPARPNTVDCEVR